MADQGHISYDDSWPRASCYREDASYRKDLTSSERSQLTAYRNW